MEKDFTQIKQIAGRIKDMREITGTSVRTLSELLGIDESEYLSAENGHVDFTFAFLQTLAKYYGVEVIELISGYTPTLKSYQISRKDGGFPLENHKYFIYENIAPYFKDKLAEPFLVTAKYNKDNLNKPIPTTTHNDEELDIVVSGTLKITVNGVTDILYEGDSLYCDANLPHGMIAIDGKDAKFISVVISKQREKTDESDYKASKIVRNPQLIFNKFATPTINKDGQLTKLDFHAPDNFNFAYDVVDELAKKCPDKTAMIWLSNEMEEKRFSFKDFATLSDKCANYFESIGIKKGDKVMLILKRHYQFWIAILALHKLGAIAIPATNQLMSHDLLYRFQKGDVKAIVCTSTGTVASESEKAFAECDVPIKVIVGDKREGWLDFNEGLNDASSSFERRDTLINEPAIMFFSSGTSGYPKLVSHAHSYALGHIVTAKYWHNINGDSLHFTIAETGWGKALWGKLYGQWFCEAAVFVYDFDRFDSKKILPLFKKYNITTFCAPPTMFRFFIKENLMDYDLSSLRYVTTAGEALNAEVFEQFYKATGLKIMEGFGQTETTLTVANLVGNQCRVGSMGKPTPQYDIVIVDKEDKPVNSGEEGEICIRTDKGAPYGLFLGYYKDEEATKRVWHDGLYHTGDMAWHDEEGLFHYVGRIDDLIKSSGYRIGPFEIESVLMELPYVLECAITGVPDPIRGQVVKATIVLTKNTVGTEELKKEIQEYVKKHTAPYKYPRIIEFVDELPKTISGKIRRVEIRNKDN